MRAFVVAKYKEPLQETDVPEPVVGAHDVLVRVEAAGLNPLDEKMHEAGSLPLVALTAWQALVERGGRDKSHLEKPS